MVIPKLQLRDFDMSWKRDSVIDRRSVKDRRGPYDPDYLLNGGVERRSWTERRSQIERREGWVRVSEGFSISLWLITGNNSL
jgi:hypothetical protein